MVKEKQHRWNKTSLSHSSHDYKIICVARVCSYTTVEIKVQVFENGDALFWYATLILDEFHQCFLKILKVDENLINFKALFNDVSEC